MRRLTNEELFDEYYPSLRTALQYFNTTEENHIYQSLNNLSNNYFWDAIDDEDTKTASYVIKELSKLAYSIINKKRIRGKHLSIAATEAILGKYPAPSTFAVSGNDVYPLEGETDYFVKFMKHQNAISTITGKRDSIRIGTRCTLSDPLWDKLGIHPNKSTFTKLCLTDLYQNLTDDELKIFHKYIHLTINMTCLSFKISPECKDTRKIRLQIYASAEQKLVSDMVKIIAPYLPNPMTKNAYANLHDIANNIFWHGQRHQKSNKAEISGTMIKKSLRLFRHINKLQSILESIESQMRQPKWDKKSWEWQIKIQDYFFEPLLLWRRELEYRLWVGDINSEKKYRKKYREDRIHLPTFPIKKKQNLIEFYRLSKTLRAKTCLN